MGVYVDNKLAESALAQLVRLWPSRAPVSWSKQAARWARCRAAGIGRGVQVPLPCLGALRGALLDSKTIPRACLGTRAGGMCEWEFPQLCAIGTCAPSQLCPAAEPVPARGGATIRQKAEAHMETAVGL